MSDPTAIGLRVLAILEEGRQRHLARRQARAVELRELVLRVDRLDRAEGRAARGRAGRIVRRLARAGVTVSERHVLKIIRSHRADSSAMCNAAVIPCDNSFPTRVVR